MDSILHAKAICLKIYEHPKLTEKPSLSLGCLRYMTGTLVTGLSSCVSLLETYVNLTLLTKIHLSQSFPQNHEGNPSFKSEFHVSHPLFHIWIQPCIQSPFVSNFMSTQSWPKNAVSYRFQNSGLFWKIGEYSWGN